MTLVRDLAAMIAGPPSHRTFHAEMARTGGHYEIRVRGHLGQVMRTAFPELRVRLDGNDTVLSGAMPDQAAVYGVLAAVESLGLELIELRRVAAG
jgi:hypothetical protein